MARILIIDDDRMICDALVMVMARMDHQADFALTLEEGRRLAEATPYDVVFLDVRLPDGSGLEALPKFQESAGNPEVIIITGDGDPEGAQLAIYSGAWDYIEKPLSKDTLTLPLLRALQYHEEKKNKNPLKALNLEGFIGESLPVRRCLNILAQAAGSAAPVLITGETGTGKELFANAIHVNSGSGNKNFVVVDCAALPETLVESTLFGHEKGAYTGADRSREGLVKMADGGTLFLDEVGEMPLSVQRGFLRVLQEHRFRPVGGKEEVSSNFRVIAATNRDIDQMVEEGRFRKDLLFRLRSIHIHLPPLRERGNDSKQLAFYFMNELCERYGMGTKGFSPELLDIVKSYSWPGNVRELIHAIENILAAAGNSPILFPEHLPTYIRAEMISSTLRKKEKNSHQPMVNDHRFLDTFRENREAILLVAEKQYLVNLMATTEWNISRACSVSDLSRARLYSLLKKHHITRHSSE